MSKTLFKTLGICSLVLTWFSAGCQLTRQGGTAPAETAPGEVAFKLAGPNDAAIIVPVKVNGQGPFNFVLDTGATLTCVDQQLIERLKLPERAGQLGIGAGIRSTGQIKLVTIDSLEVGTAKASSLMGCGLDLQQLKGVGVEAEGLLGLNFLKSYRVVLNFERKTLQLE